MTPTTELAHIGTAIVSIEHANFACSISEMSDDSLADIVIAGCQQFHNIIPHVIELRERFNSRPRGTANIAGCQTWTEFCEKKLDRKIRAVQTAIAAFTNPSASVSPKPKEKSQPKPKPVKEYQSLIDAVPIIRAGREIVSPSQYGVAEIEETVTAFTVNLVSQLKTVADKKTIYRSLVRKFEDLLGECDGKTDY